MKPYILLLVLIVTGVNMACGPSVEERASLRLREARNFLQKNDTTRALLEIDSLFLLFPKASYTLHAADNLRREVRWELRQRNEIKLEMIGLALDSLLKNFETEKGEFDRKPKWIHKNQVSGNLKMQSCLKVETDEKGEMVLSGYYYGKNHHTRLIVSAGEEKAETKDIPFGNIDNYQGDSFGMKWDRLTFRNGSDNGVIGFIATRSSQKIKVVFAGKSNDTFLLTDSEKTAIRESAGLSGLLIRRKKLSGEIKLLQD
jgi:hypothetical protein